MGKDSSGWDVVSEIKPSWIHQPKGMLQVAFELSMIDPLEYNPKHGTRQQTYIVSNKNNVFGNFMEDLSLSIE